MSDVKITLVKNGPGKVTVFLKRTRREEKRVFPETNVPVDQLGAAIESMVKKARVNGRPGTLDL